MLSLRKWDKLLQVKKFSLLPAMAILHVLETAPCTTMTTLTSQLAKLKA